MQTPGELLLSRLSHTHLEVLAALEPRLKRIFYEIECIKGTWSVRELKRQIGSLYFERSGLSRDKEMLAALAQERAEARQGSAKLDFAPVARLSLLKTIFGHFGPISGG